MMARSILAFVILCSPLVWGKIQFGANVVKFRSNFSSAWVPQSRGDHPLRLARAAGRASMMKDVDKLEITRLHNMYRTMVVPPAADMGYMEWDERIASIAQEWADQCIWKHGHPRHDFAEGLGQNLYKGWSSSTGYTMRLWYDEYIDYHFDTVSCNPGKQCGHYTQVVWSKSRLVGCGIKEGCWRDYRYFIVCNYWPPGNYIGAKPYKVGEPCTSCEGDSQLCWNKTCVNLSQCKKYKLVCGCDLVCRNCGELDREKCACKCNDGWKGVDCSVPCADKRQDCSPNSCQYYRNSRHNPCEKTCKICKSANPDDPQDTCCDGVICPPGQRLDLSNRPCECVNTGTSLRGPSSPLLFVVTLLLGYSAL